MSEHPTPHHGFFRQILYTRLQKGPLSRAEFDAMLAHGTNNERAHANDYWEIAALINKIWAQKSEP